MKSYQMGDPLKQETDLGPLAHSDLWDNIYQQVRDSIERAPY